MILLFLKPAFTCRGFIWLKQEFSHCAFGTFTKVNDLKTSSTIHSRILPHFLRFSASLNFTFTFSFLYSYTIHPVLLVCFNSLCLLSDSLLSSRDLTVPLSSSDFHPHTRTCKCTPYALFTHTCLKQIAPDSSDEKVSTVCTPFFEEIHRFRSSPHASAPLHPEGILLTMLHRSPLPIPPLLYSSLSPLLPLCVHLSGPCNSTGTSHLKPSQ